MLRTLEPALNRPACTPLNLVDDAGDEALLPLDRGADELGVVTGCNANPPLDCPSAPVRHEQMGVFISATFGLLLWGP